MKHAIAIAKAKIKKYGTLPETPKQSVSVENEISRIGLGILIIVGGVFGLGGLLTLVAALVSEKGPLNLLYKWLGSITGW